jgi:ABC-2 type transport system permease protein
MGLILELHKGVPDFAIHLFTGMVVVHYFGESWSHGTSAIWSNKGLVKKNRIPREIFPVAMMLVAAYHTMPQVLVLVFFCLLTGWHLTWSALAAGALGLAIIVSFATALALIFSALNVFYRDFQNIVRTIMQFMHFLVPMMYPFTRIWAAHDSHPWIYNLYMANPVAQVVLLFQRFFWWPLLNPAERAQAGPAFPPNQWTLGLITLAASLLLLWLAQKYFTRAEARFPERL